MTEHWCKYCNGVNTHNCQFNPNLPRIKSYTTNTVAISDDEALLRQALEALESCDGYMEQLELIVYSRDDTGPHDVRAKVQSTIAALRERLGEKA